MPLKTFFAFLQNISKHRELILSLAVRNLKTKYIGTVGGFFWAFVQPIAIVVVFYFVFAVGFKSGDVDGVPYIIWFVVGLACWFYFNDTVSSSSGSILSNQHLVKKTVFPTEILPLIDLLTNLFSHFVFLVAIVIMLLWLGIDFSIGLLLLPYYLFCSAFLALGLGWLFSSLTIFYRDVAQAIPIILNILFWATPIVWTKTIVPKEYSWIIDCNPFLYVIDGYRNSIIYGKLILPDMGSTIFFWAFASAVFALGFFVFMRLKQDFADVI